MNRLDCLDDALLALGAFLDAHGHGPACVCGPCTAYQQGSVLLPRLGHLLAILQEWSRGEICAEDDEGFTAEDIGMALWVLDDDHPPRPT